MLLAYFSPEMTLPLASILSAAVGFFVLVGRAPIRVAKRSWRLLLERLRLRKPEVSTSKTVVTVSESENDS